MRSDLCINGSRRYSRSRERCDLAYRPWHGVRAHCRLNSTESQTSTVALYTPLGLQLLWRIFAFPECFLLTWTNHLLSHYYVQIYHYNNYWNPVSPKILIIILLRRFFVLTTNMCMCGSACVQMCTYGAPIVLWKRCTCTVGLRRTSLRSTDGQAATRVDWKKITENWENAKTKRTDGETERERERGERETEKRRC